MECQHHETFEYVINLDIKFTPEWQRINSLTQFFAKNSDTSNEIKDARKIIPVQWFENNNYACCIPRKTKMTFESKNNNGNAIVFALELEKPASKWWKESLGKLGYLSMCGNTNLRLLFFAAKSVLIVVVVVIGVVGYSCTRTAGRRRLRAKTAEKRRKNIPISGLFGDWTRYCKVQKAKRLVSTRKRAVKLRKISSG